MQRILAVLINYRIGNRFCDLSDLICGCTYYICYKGFCFLLILMFFIGYSSIVTSAETTPPNESTQAQAPEQTSTTITPKLTWPVNQQDLSKQSQASEKLWVEVEGEPLLVLKYWAKGRKLRGDVLLIHAQGENADHPRLILPLAVQLSNLGWQVFVANLPLQDYPPKSTLSGASEETSQSNTATPSVNGSQGSPSVEPNQNASTQAQPIPTAAKPSQVQTYFKDAKTYQNYVTLALSQITLQVQPKGKNFILIGNQNGAYWILEATINNSAFTQVVLIQPEIPDSIDNEINGIFADQHLPVYSFITKTSDSDPFSRDFDQQLWKSNFMRVDRGQLSNSRLEMEDPSIAKKITGWIESQQKLNR